VSARTAKLLRTAEDHEHSLFFALSGHRGIYITNQSAGRYEAQVRGYCWW
jgi:hypothetical protein